MVDYKGSKCISCGKEFKDGDDIVVCPDCGTPYHRHCYAENGKCINDKLHESGEVWLPDSEKDKAPAKRICMRCHQENPENALYCCRCGLPFGNAGYGSPYGNSGTFRESINSAPVKDDNTQNRGFTDDPDFTQPFFGFTVNYSDPLCGFNPSEEYENGVKLAELGAFVDSNTHYYLPKFKFMKETGTGTALNFTAMFFPQFFFAYRKMPLMAVVSAVILFVTGFPQMLSVVKEMEIGGVLGNIAAMFDMRSSAFSTLSLLCYIIGLAFRVYTSFNANKLYYRHCLKKIPAIKSHIPENFTLSELHREGGTSAGLLILFIAVYFITSTLLSALVIAPV